MAAMLPDDELLEAAVGFRDALSAAIDARRRQAWDEARRLLEEAARLAQAAGADAEVDVARGHLALLAGNRERAEPLLARAVAADPADAAALAMLIADRWPASPRDCETHLVARAGTFRRLCRELPRSGEVALELGAAHGHATRMLAEKCATVYAVEKAPAMAERAREATADLPNVRLIRASADDLALVRAHVPRADVVCLDIGGSTPFAKVLHRAREYRELYQPRVLIVRNVYLNNFVAGLASHEPTYGASIWKKPK